MLVVGEFEVFELEFVERFVGDVEGGEFFWCASELFFEAFEVVGINVGVPYRVDEDAGREVGFFGEHHEQSGVAGDVVRYAEGDVGGALVELEVEAAIDDIELEKAVARRQSHFSDVGGIPSGDDDAAGVGVVFELVDGLGDLVDVDFCV